MIKTTPVGNWKKPVQLISAVTTGLCITGTSVYAAPVLEEVIVTAQKREQSLQDVPVAVSAFSGAALTEAVVKDVFDLQTNVPGLIVGQDQNATTSTFSIRGVGTSSQNFGLESSVGLYVDGVYRSRQSSMINNMVDISGVEVLRGPQGTLFGKNTPSGAILFKTVAPSHEQDGFLEVTAGNYDLLNVSGAANISAIEDVLAFRVTGFSGQRNGFVDVVGKGDDVLNDRDRWGVRLQALYTPTENLSVRVIADHAEVDEICCAALALLDNIGLTNAESDSGAPSSDTVMAGLGATVFDGSDYFDYRTALNDLPVSRNEDRGLSVEINWDRGDYTLTSISAYRAFDSFDQVDTDFTDLDLINQINDAEQSSFSQEFRLTYQGEKVKYVVGGYYFTQDIDLIAELENRDAVEPFILSLNPGLQGLINGMVAANGLTGGLVPVPADPFLAPSTSIDRSKQEHQSWALFGQTDINLSESLVLTLGLRYTEEDKEMESTFSEVLPGGASLPLLEPGDLPNPTAAGAVLGGLQQGVFDPASLPVFEPFTIPGWGHYLFVRNTPRPDLDVSEDDKQVSGAIKLSWFMNEDVMLYGSYGTGYKSGGTNTDRIAAVFDPVFDAETSESFELGMKADFPEQALRLNLALHYTTVDDFQANAFTGLGFNLQNAGELETYGGEVELLWAATETLNVNLAYAHNIAEFKQFKRGNCRVATPFHTGEPDPGDATPGAPKPVEGESCDRSGDRVDGNPENTLTLTVKQNFTLADSITAYVAGEYRYLSDTVLDVDNDPFKFRDAYDLVNLRAGLRFDNHGMDLTLWGRNVLDEEYTYTAFDVPLQDGKLDAYPGEPATYGLTLRKQF